MYNNKTNADVYKSAKDYGFDDLRLIPYIQLSDNMSIRVTKLLCKMWDKKPSAVITKAYKNTAKEDFRILNIKTMFCTQEDINNGAPNLYAITNDKFGYGAVGVIFLKERLAELFPTGYKVLPSSIHDVLVLGNDDMRIAGVEKFLDLVINDVNDTCIKPEEVLGNKFYEFVNP